MSEQRFDRIDERLERLEVGQRELRADVGRVEAGQHDLRADVGRLEAGQQELRADLNAHVGRLDRRIARIAAIPEYTGPTKAEMDQGFADLREMINRRLDPLEATVRQHSVEIDRLEQGRG